MYRKVNAEEHGVSKNYVGLHIDWTEDGFDSEVKNAFGEVVIPRHGGDAIVVRREINRRLFNYEKSKKEYEDIIEAYENMNESQIAELDKSMYQGHWENRLNSLYAWLDVHFPDRHQFIEKEILERFFDVYVPITGYDENGMKIGAVCRRVSK